MGRGIRSSAFAGGGVALTADGLEFTIGSCQTLQRIPRGQRKASRQRGQRRGQSCPCPQPPRPARCTGLGAAWAPWLPHRGMLEGVSLHEETPLEMVIC